MPKFVPGEVAVLRNDRGGRLFVVHEVAFRAGREVVLERHSIPDQQKYVSETRPDQLVKCKTEADARNLAAVLDYVHEAYRRKEHDLQADRRREFANVISRYEAEPEDEG